MENRSWTRVSLSSPPGKEESSRRGPAPEKVTWGQMLVSKALGVYFSRPYSLTLCTETARVLRGVFFTVLAAAGVSSLFAGAGRVVWLPFAGTISMIFFGAVLLAGSVALLLFGLARSLFVLPVAALVLFLWKAVTGLLSAAWGRSFALFLELTALAAFLLFWLLRSLFKRLIIGMSATFWQFERGGLVRAVDLPLGELPAVKGRPIFLRCRFSLGDPGRLNVFLRECVFTMILHRIVFCGYALDPEEGGLTLYLYADREGRAARVLSKLLARRHLPEARVEAVPDPSWHRFREEVYPDEQEYQRIHNRVLYEDMEADRFDFAKEVPQIFAFSFEKEEDARAFAEKAAGLGYEDARYVERETGKQGSLPAYAVFAQLTGRAGLARLNFNTDRAVEQAASFHGHFYEWTLGRLDGEEMDARFSS